MIAAISWLSRASSAVRPTSAISVHKTPAPNDDVVLGMGDAGTLSNPRGANAGTRPKAVYGEMLRDK
jgi:hypothetical protein